MILFFITLDFLGSSLVKTLGPPDFKNLFSSTDSLSEIELVYAKIKILDEFLQKSLQLRFGCLYEAALPNVIYIFLSL